jgi:glucokinase
VRRLGLDIGGSQIKLALLDGEEVVDTRSADSAAEEGPPAVLARLAALAGDASAADSVGVALPGVLAASGAAALLANLPGWEGLDVRAELRRALGRDLAFLNDGHAFGLAESRLGAGRGAQSMFGVVVGTGVGGALVLDGRLQRGAGGRAGELGHATVEPDGPECACGNRGCLELYAGAPAIARAAGRDSFAEVAAAGTDGDAAALAAIEAAGRRVGVAVTNLLVTLAPERIVVGGGVVAATGELLLGPLRGEVGRRARGVAALDSIAIVPAELGRYAGAIGAALAGSGS